MRNATNGKFKRPKKSNKMLIEVPAETQKALTTIAENRGLTGKKKLVEMIAQREVDIYNKRQLRLIDDHGE